MDQSLASDRQSEVGRLLYEVKRVIVGQDHMLERIIVGLLARGHLLVEGVPGLAKTLAIKTVAGAVHGDFKRIQFTPDLVPADLIGTRIYNQKNGEFQTSLGPVFTNLLLADEINRAPAKVQSALLEAMQERQVTIGRETHKLPDPFLVMATQNPIEYEGTFPLPEAQLDRFFIRLQLGYPKPKEEVDILDAQRVHHPLDSLTQVMSAEELLRAQADARDVHIAEAVKQYVVAVVGATRSHPDVYLGASPRGSLALARAAQAYAAVRGRDYVVPDDVKALAGPTLAHRLILQPQARLKDLAQTTVVAEVLASVPVEVGSLTALRA